MLPARAGLFGDLVEADCPTGVRFSIGISLRKPLNAILMRSSTMRRMPTTSLVGLYAKLGRTRVLSSRSVVHSAERIAKKIMDTYLEPDKSFVELRDMAKLGSIDLSHQFSDAYRDEFESDARPAILMLATFV